MVFFCLTLCRMKRRENSLIGNIAKISPSFIILVSHTVGKLSLSWIWLCHVDHDLSCSRAVTVHRRKLCEFKTTVDSVITVSRLASLFPLLRSRSGFKLLFCIGTSIWLRISTYEMGGAGSFCRKKDFMRRFWSKRIVKLRLPFVNLSRYENRGSEKLLIAFFPVSRFSLIQSYLFSVKGLVDRVTRSKLRR